MSLALVLPEEIVDAIAVRVAALVLDELPGPEREEPWRLLTLDEAAECLGRSTRWLRERKHQIGYVRLDGGALAFRLEELQAFAAARIVGGPPPFERVT